MNRIIPYIVAFLAMSCHSQNDKFEKTELATKPETPESFISKNQSDTLLNTKEYLILGDTLGKVKVVNENEVAQFPTFEVLIGYRDDVIISEQIAYDNVEIYKKYSPNTSFEDYPAEIYKSNLAEPDFSTAPAAKRFMTRIKEECDKGINFAGHYTLVTWGCGSPCQSGVVVDRKTGQIFGGYGTSLGSEFKKDSKMIIKNVGAIDRTTNLIEVCAYCEVAHEIWTGTAFKEIE
ncbi:MAG: hypothetical protein AAF502_21455 [Bacteroidota bacterium]